MQYVLCFIEVVTGVLARLSCIPIGYVMLYRSNHTYLQTAMTLSRVLKAEIFLDWMPFLSLWLSWWCSGWASYL